MTMGAPQKCVTPCFSIASYLVSLCAWVGESPVV